jgi:hypothetical protein
VTRSPAKKTSLFLIELVIAVLFFSVCAAVCMRVFAAAKINTEHSKNLSNASVKLQSAAELYKNAGGDLALLAEKLGAGVLENGLVVLYDGEWNAVSEEKNAEFILFVEREQSGEYLESAVISVKKAGQSDSLFSISVKAAKKIGICSDSAGR